MLTRDYSRFKQMDKNRSVFFLSTNRDRSISHRQGDFKFKRLIISFGSSYGFKVNPYWSGAKYSTSRTLRQYSTEILWQTRANYCNATRLHRRKRLYRLELELNWVRNSPIGIRGVMHANRITRVVLAGRYTYIRGE